MNKERKECPMHNKFPNGCRFWKDNENGWHKGKYSCGNCNFDFWKPRDSEGYGPFYEGTHCIRIGTIYSKDEYLPVNNYKEVADLINLGEILRNKIDTPSYEWNGIFKSHLIKVYEEVISKLKNELIVLYKERDAIIKSTENDKVSVVDSNGYPIK